MATKSSGRKSTKRKSSNGLSPTTKKAIDTLPSRAQYIYTKAHKYAIEQFEPLKEARRQAQEHLAHKVAWGCGEISEIQAGKR